jgi:septum site-determining protein MinC
MPANTKGPNGDRPAAFELKAASFTLPVVRLLDGDMEAVAEQIGAKVEQAPDFFRNAPVVIDLGGLPDGAGDVEFPLLVGLLRGYGMIPFGIRGGNRAQNAAAERMELAILGEAYSRPVRTGGAASAASAQAAASQRSAAPESQASVAAGPSQPSPAVESMQRPGQSFTIVTRPVRSGQRVQAIGGDLSVVAPVSSGAELMADGNIHIYGPLRGRALAGMNGNTDARIFCQDLQAELVSIAGHYRVSENIPPDLRGVPVQVYLDQKVLRIERL